MKGLGAREMRSVCILAVSFLVAFVFAGCQYVGPGEPPGGVLENEDDIIVLQPGDTIDIAFFYAPELNQSQTVRPDGKIALPSAGEVVAEGKTPAQLNSELTALYAKIIQKPDLAVIVRSLKNRVVYVSGEVVAPGPVQLTSKLTALEAIMQAGGFRSETAMMNKVVIIRYIEDKRHRYVLDLKGVITGRSVQKPFQLVPGDMVIVPSKVE